MFPRLTATRAVKQSISMAPYAGVSRADISTTLPHVITLNKHMSGTVDTLHVPSITIHVAFTPPTVGLILFLCIHLLISLTHQGGSTLL